MSFLNKIKQITSSNPKKVSVLGVDISPSTIKIVQIRRDRGQAILETYGEIALGPYAGLEVGQPTNLSAEKVAEALRDLMSEAKVTTNRCAVSIPFASSLITLLQVPTTDEEKLKTVIPLEARKYIPVPIEEVILDWYVIPPAPPTDPSSPQEERSYTEALAIAIHKDTINRHQKIIHLSNLEASFFEIEIFSTVRAVLDHGVAPVVILDIGFASTKLYIVEHGIIRRSHNISRGTQDITRAIASSMNVPVAQAEVMKRSVDVTSTEDSAAVAASAVLNHIISETSRIMVEFERKHSKPVDKVILTGTGVALNGIFPYAKEKFDVEVEIANPFKKVETPALLDNVLTEVGPSFAVSIGLSLRELEEID
jgi:type IV pilus assembly protein PilM